MFIRRRELELISSSHRLEAMQAGCTAHHRGRRRSRLAVQYINATSTTTEPQDFAFLPANQPISTTFAAKFGKGAKTASSSSPNRLRQCNRSTSACFFAALRSARRCAGVEGELVSISRMSMTRSSSSVALSSIAQSVRALNDMHFIHGDGQSSTHASQNARLASSPRLPVSPRCHCTRATSPCRRSRSVCRHRARRSRGRLRALSKPWVVRRRLKRRREFDRYLLMVRRDEHAKLQLGVR